MNNTSEFSPTSNAIRNPMEPWYTKAWVRQDRLKYGVPENVTTEVMFSPKLVPALKHPLVAARGERFAYELLAACFYSYANFTSVLEREAVNVATLHLARRNFWSKLPSHMYSGAGRIYTDEAFHAQESDEIKEKLVDSSGIEPDHLVRPRFMDRLNKLLDSLPPRLQMIALFGFSIVSETLISAILSDIPNDPFVMPCVRDFVREHAKDEGRHHAYFSDLLKFGWPGLSMEDREFLGPLLPQFIRWFLDPDLAWLESFLRSKGFDKPAIETIINESYPAKTVTQNIRNAAKHSVARFRSEGVLEAPCTLDAFAAAGLL